MEPSAEVLARASVTARGVVSAPLAEAEALRAKPGPVGEFTQVAKTLRNADEQTVAAVAAMMRAIEFAGWMGRTFRDWGVVGCPRFLGRMLFSGLLTRYFGDAKYSINPHVIPNLSLHSPSGTASVGLEMHGPNFGVGGGPGHVAEGFLTAISVLKEGRVPGLWLLLAEFDPEPIPDRLGKPTNDVAVHAVALALQQEGKSASLCLTRRPVPTRPASLKELAGFLSAGGDGSWTCAVDGLGSIELTIAGPTGERP